MVTKIFAISCASLIIAVIVTDTILMICEALK